MLYVFIVACDLYSNFSKFSHLKGLCEFHEETKECLLCPPQLLKGYCDHLYLMSTKFHNSWYHQFTKS